MTPSTGLSTLEMEGVSTRKTINKLHQPSNWNAVFHLILVLLVVIASRISSKSCCALIRQKRSRMAWSASGRVVGLLSQRSVVALGCARRLQCALDSRDRRNCFLPEPYGAPLVDSGSRPTQRINTTTPRYRNEQAEVDPAKLPRGSLKQTGISQAGRLVLSHPNDNHALCIVFLF